MNISVEITGNLLEYLDSKVKKGFYKSRSEVMREAIREMIRRDLQDELDSKGITLDDLNKTRDDVAGEIIAKKYSHLK